MNWVDLYFKIKVIGGCIVFGISVIMFSVIIISNSEFYENIKKKIKNILKGE